MSTTDDSSAADRGSALTEGLGPLPAHRMDMHMAAIPVRCRDDAKRYAEAYAREAVAAERERWESALRTTWRMVDPLRPEGQPGSYARGNYNGIVAALGTLRANLRA